MTSPLEPTPRTSTRAGRAVLWSAVLIGLAIRGVVLWHTSALGTGIVDEQHYRQLAESLVAGYGFAWGPHALTSIRPPLYPAMMAAAWWLLGHESLQAIRYIQVGLGLATAGVVYLIGARVYGAAIGRYAAAAAWLYPSLIYYNALILTETLFTLLLLLFVLLTVMLVQSPRAWTAVTCGIALGLAALTRSVLWPLPLVLCPLLAVLIREPLVRRLALPGLVLIGYVLTVGPWAVRNTRLQHVVTIVDTMGGINLRMGNYEYTPDDRMWDAVSLTGERSWVHGISDDLPGQDVTEGQKEKWAQRKAIEYIAAHPATTVRRDLIKFADFWGLEREFIAGVEAGLFSPPRWFAAVGTLAIVLGYVAVVLIGGIGMWVSTPRDWRLHVLLLLPVLVTLAAHTLVFGHSRYHVPLMPIFGIYGAALLGTHARAWRWSFSPARIGATATVAVFLAVWMRQIVLVDLARITAMLHQIG